jgi:hypothetical protein
MTEPPSLLESTSEEPSPSTTRDHPPFKLRERRLVLLPDLRPPSLEELRWAARERRRRRETSAPERRPPESHDQPDVREPADVPTTLVQAQSQELTEAPPRVEPTQEDAAPVEIVLPDVAAPAAAASPPLEAEPVVESDIRVEVESTVDDDFLDLDDPAFPDLRPWQPVVLPDAGLVDEAEPEPGDGGETSPLISQILVVREPVAPEPGRIAVLDEVETEAATITRLVPLPASPEATVAEAAPYEEIAPDRGDYGAPELEVAAEDDGRAAPLYWRLLRLRHTRPNGWLRALYFEGAVTLGVVLVLADVASVWTIVVLPLIVAVVVKANDVVAGSLRPIYRPPQR